MVVSPLSREADAARGREKSRVVVVVVEVAKMNQGRRFPQAEIKASGRGAIIDTAETRKV